MAKVEAVKQRKFKFRQSPTEHLPKLPVRCIVAAPSSGGKSNLVVQLITNQAFYRGCFDRIYYFSASADLDSGLLPVKRYCEDELEMDPKENPCLRNTWDEGFIAEAIENQRRIVTRLKAEKSRDPCRSYSSCAMISLIRPRSFAAESSTHSSCVGGIWE